MQNSMLVNTYFHYTRKPTYTSPQDENQQLFREFFAFQTRVLSEFRSVFSMDFFSAAMASTLATQGKRRQGDQGNASLSLD
jgi:hypothetical protein